MATKAIATVSTFWRRWHYIVFDVPIIDETRPPSWVNGKWIRGRWGRVIAMELAAKIAKASKAAKYQIRTYTKRGVYRGFVWVYEGPRTAAGQRRINRGLKVGNAQRD